MVIVFDETTVLNVEKVISMMIKHTPTKEKVLKSSGFLGLNPQYETISTDSWTLEFEYVAVNNIHYRFTCSNINHNSIRNTGLEIIAQLKRYDSTIVDKAFEDAFLKEK